MTSHRLYFLLLSITGMLHISSYAQERHHVRMIAGSTGNQLEVLDFGGRGQSILFLTGLTNTAHVYDGFAPRFTDQYHVYAMSRRGYGASEQTKAGYGIDTLANDIFALVNALQLGKVILIGHSMGGDEITTFATRFPEKVSKVIYLDAAYDHSQVKLSFPADPEETKIDSSSVGNYNNYLKRIRGFKFPEDELRHQYVLSAEGVIKQSVTPWRIGGAIVRGVRLPDYKLIKQPALAIYGRRDTAQEYFPGYAYMDSLNRQKTVNDFMPAWKKYYDQEISRFRNEIARGTIKEIPGADHYVFLTHPVETEKLIRDFLSKND